MKILFARVNFDLTNFSDKPATPTLTSSSASPVDGGNVILTCASATAEVNAYEFFKDGSSVQATTSATYTLNPATIVTHDGSYTCKAKRDTVVSDASTAVALACKLVYIKHESILVDYSRTSIQIPLF